LTDVVEGKVATVRVNCVDQRLFVVEVRGYSVDNERLFTLSHSCNIRLSYTSKSCPQKKSCKTTIAAAIATTITPLFIA
jgi:hypothetical protein